ncbi:SAM-dependent methyltransferase [Candidatus Roizmanbacteria bacterium CG11_big_fil_rev_8_21_14_0_20_36_8]|uniref:SAM-dependent methyltransferase n=2 Tax=Patescibacteria group TaxID=1783273 RepID=A0A2M6IUK2_9BACT|nr:MAG: SAM-dependent methyltransferase [Candidatus Roizmanbacteria bacterium CG11_big_fil_rev_8_21_14_0_20_36_8]
MSLTKQQFKEFYDKVGSKIGWDFSKVKHTSEGVKWELYDEVIKKCKKTDILLDIGTGGGEKVLKIAQNLQLVIGIDISDGMIDTARKNMLRSKVNNARFFVMDSESIKFPDNMFNIISCRHSDFSPTEVFRLVVQGGIFLSQQVGEADKINIKDFFGRGQAFGVKEGTAMKNYTSLLKDAGFSRVETREYDAIEYYERPEDLVFLLKHTPTVTNFGQESRDFEKLENFIKQNISDKGIKTNSKRYMLIAEK